MNKPKYIFVYNGISFPANSLLEIAEKMFGFKVTFDEELLSWRIWLNGKMIGTSYCSKEKDKTNGYTKEEVIKDWLSINRLTFANTAIYQLCETKKYEQQ